MERQQLQTSASKVFNEAHAHAKNQGFEFGEGARYYLMERASNLEDLLNQMDVEERATKFAEARRNFVKVVDNMIVASKVLPGYAEQHPGEIGEQTLGEALSKLCPIWPFCD